MKKSVFAGMMAFMVVGAGCADHSRQKMLEWEKAYQEGNLTYYEKEHLKVLERGGRRLPARYYVGAHRPISRPFLGPVAN